MSPETLANIISNFCVGTSTFILVIVGIGGLQQWRRELKGKARFELARKCIQLLFKFRYQFHNVRKPIIFVTEQNSLRDGESLGVEEEFVERNKQLEILNDIAEQLHETGWEASLILSDTIYKQIEFLLQKSNSLSNALRIYILQRQIGKGASLSTDSMIAYLQDLRNTFSGTEDDELGLSVNKEITSIMDALKKYVP